jgi:hypothetical protein
MTWVSDWPLPELMKNETIFLTVVDPSSLTAARLMVASLRAFGGELADAPVWVFSSHPAELAGLEDAATHLQPLDGVQLLPCPFAEKVAACARAEAIVPAGTRSLVWIDPGCLVVQPPLGFALGLQYDAAFRPVHIRNVGLPPSEPLDPFWQGIYRAAGMEDIHTTVTSFVDGQLLRSYFNTHAFAINPGMRLMGHWHELFLQLAGDAIFQAAACADEPHQIFLFQALLSALAAGRIKGERICLLPPTYNYPCHLQERVPPGRRITVLNDLVCFAYEDLDPRKLAGFAGREPLITWLAELTNT